MELNLSLLFISMAKNIIFILISALLISCSQRDRYGDKKIFKYNVGEGITSLDPAAASRLENISAVNQLFNGLVQMDENLNIQACIAKRWIVLDNGLTYQFTLRDDVYFHKHGVFGEDSTRKVIASDFKYSFSRLIDPNVLSPGKWVMNPVEKNELGQLKIQALNDTTLQIHLKEAFPPFLGILSMMYCNVVPEEAMAYYGESFRANPIGTGPFQFKYWKENSKLVFLKNENYFEMDENGNNLPYLDAISISFVKDQEVAFLKFIQKDIDFLSGLKGSYKDELLNADGALNQKYRGSIQYSRSPYLNTEYLGFMIDDSLSKDHSLRNKFLRRAINFGFDRQKMLNYLRNGIGTPASSGFVPKGLPSFDADIIKGFHYSPDSVKSLLIKAGYPGGEGLSPIELNTSPQYLDICEYLQHQLGTFGIPIKIVVNQAATNNELIANAKVFFFRKSWVADYPDAENYLSLFRSINFAPSGPNYTHFKNKLYDNWYSRAMQTDDNEKRFHLYQKMDSMIVSEAPVVPLFYDEVVRFTQNNIEGLGTNAMNLIDLRKVKKLDVEKN